MLVQYFDSGGPVMYAVLAAWVVVLAGVLDRISYAVLRGWRRPLAQVRALALAGEVSVARRRLAEERRRAEHGLARIDSFSQLAPSIGLFGTVLGIAQSFFARGVELGLAAPDVLASGLSTALFTTIGGLVVFLFGQLFLIIWREWETACERRVEEVSELFGHGGS